MPPRTFEASRFLVAVVALEAVARRGVDDLAHRFLGVQRAVRRRRTGPAGFLRRCRGRRRRWCRPGRSERAGRHRRVAADDDESLGRAVAVADVAVEAVGELPDVGLRRLVAECEPQRGARRRPVTVASPGCSSASCPCRPSSWRRCGGCRASCSTRRTWCASRTGPTPWSALANPVKSELLWKNGSGAYTALPGPSCRRRRRGPCDANRPCVQRTAFGKPVEPDVKIRR